MKLNGYVGTIAQKDGYIYQNGKTGYKILIPQNASEAEEYAASELTDILSKAGISIETVTDDGVLPCEDAKYISIGNTVYFRSLGIKMLQSEYKFDGFIIESVGNTYVIKGVGDTGTCFGVYGFAEYAFGYVYYAPDEYKINDFAKNLEFHIKDIPTFFGRNAFSYYTAHVQDNGFRLRINGEFARRDAKHGEGRPWSTLSDQSYAMQILDYRKYREAHPDWFYLSPDKEDAPPPQCYPQICFSKGLYDKEFFDTFMHNLINDYIAKESDKVFFMLGISDNTDFCNCDSCQKEVKKYTRSGLSMRFVNKVADAVEEWRLKNAPERVIYLISFAYLTTFEAPVIKKDGAYLPIDPSVIARDNVIIQYAPIHADYMYPLMDEEHNPESRESILGWKSVAKNMCVWDYRQDFHTQSFPYPTTLTAQANHDTYMELGFIEVFNQAQHFCAGSAFIQMDDFARARMHWNGKESYDELCDEFRKAFYKDAEPFVTEYLHAIESYYPTLVKRGWTVRYNNGAAMRKYYYTIDEMRQFAKILDKALDAARNIADKEISKKVYDRVNVLTLFYKFVLVICFPLEIPKDEALALIADLRKITKDYGFTAFYKWAPTDDYLDDAENIVSGKISETQRKFPLKEKN